MTNNFADISSIKESSKIKKKLREIIGNNGVEKIKRISGIAEMVFQEKGFINKCQFDNEEKSVKHFKCFTEADAHLFYGYYDRNPFSSNEDRVLVSRLPSDAIKKNNKCMNLGYFEINGNDDFVKIDDTVAWSWQQGSMMQWLPGSENNSIYNVYEKGRYITRIKNVEKMEIQQEIDIPFYAIDPFGEKAVTCNFDRLNRLRPGYGFSCAEDKTNDSLAPIDDGVWILDVKSGKYELIVSLNQLSNVSKDKSMLNAHHYAHHFLFNEDGTRFLFIHLWKINGMQKSRMFTYNIKTGRLNLLSSYYTSHYYWIGADKVLAFSMQPKTGLAYYLYDDNEGMNVEVVNISGYEVDGHCSYIKAKNFILTDTYPDKAGFQRLGLMDFKTRKVKTIAKFYSSLAHQNERRCDLHPRASGSGNLIAVDVSRGKNRELGILQLNNCAFE